MTEVLVPMGSLPAFAASDLSAGRLFEWSHIEKNVTYTAEGERPIGIIINDVYAEELLSETGSAEWFIRAGVVRVPLDTDIAIGTEVMSGADGTIVEQTGTNYAFGVVLTARNSEGEAEIYIY